MSKRLPSSYLDAAMSLLQCSRQDFDRLSHINRGPVSASMRTLGLHVIVRDSICYRCTREGLIKVTEPQEQSIHLHSAVGFRNYRAPPHLKLNVIWEKRPQYSGVRNNILGNNGRLLLQESRIRIPAIMATPRALAYYGATLIEPDNCVYFHEKAFPIWEMNIDKKYVSEFLMTNEGGGFYLEYHLDRPHYHQVLEGKGYYILAKPNADLTSLQLTAFQIPAYHAIYTPKGVIHCDAALVGKYLVGYALSRQFSTVMLHVLNEPSKRVVVKFYNA